ncbi:glycoside hydrolase family 10 protein [Periconia macrospinosa]|uniref:Beta-xylanase n=1 Tax=Periconia macrospinosa TaxID=97972 RepID=A0A2V1DNP0_9PLEO|nr:glycoside hydrolase family 10 protein [Periconia macrospinosa]
MKASTISLYLLPLVAAAAPPPPPPHSGTYKPIAPPKPPKPSPHPPKPPSNTSYPGLGALASLAGIYFGTAIDNVVLNNTAYTTIAHNASEFNQVTPSNAQKWMYTEPSRNVFTYTNASAIFNPARAAHQLRRCHTFVWHNQLPDWLTNGNWTAATLKPVLENHIKNVAREFREDCFAWDVVNEAFEDDGSLRKSIWLEVLGKEYIEWAFVWARKYTEGKAKLYYNDYGIERVNNKSLAVREMVKDFLARDIPIDGVGLQSHFTVGRAPTYDEVTAALNLYTPYHPTIETALTELDVRILLPSTPATRTLQANVYVNATRACVEMASCVGVTVWDFWDPVSWVPESFPGYGEACLFDEGLGRKEAYFEVKEYLRGVGR